jgi:hypothetical protein
MLPSSRKGFYFNVEPSDRQLWAIGMVAVHWSLLETHMEVFVNGLTKDDPVSLEEFKTSQTFERRLSQWRNLVELKMIEPYKSRVLAVIKEIGEMQHERHRIIHSNWSGDDTHFPGSEKTRAFSWTGHRPSFSWKLSFAQIVGIAKKIDALNAKIFQSVMDFRERPENLLFSDALQRTLVGSDLRP